MEFSKRQNDILDYLKKNRKASVNELMSIFYVSAASVRRDLTTLQSEGFVSRTHGGVIYSDNTKEKHVEFRLTQNIERKEKTAEVALKVIPDFETAFVDDSSTCHILMERCDLNGKTIFTNSLILAMRLSQIATAQVVVPSGTVSPATQSITGDAAIEGIMRFRPDVAFVSCAAVDNNFAYENTAATAALKRVAIEHANTKILLFDSSKLGQTATFGSAALSDFDIIITDAKYGRLGFTDTYGTRVYTLDKSTPPPTKMEQAPNR